jgi:acetyl esterase/lipase
MGLGGACALLFAFTIAACAQTRTAQQSAPQASAPTPPAPRVLPDVPTQIDKGARYLIYLHGRIIEEQGTRAVSPVHGAYEYEQILAALAAGGYTVISDVRPRGTDADEYAAKVAGQVGALLKAGVPPGHVTVVGASKGGGIAVLTSALVRNRDVNFVVLAGCGAGNAGRPTPPDVWGHILSIYDSKDDGVTSCQRLFERSTGLGRHREIVTQVGIGHGLLYRPFKEWVGPTIAWGR